MSRLGRTTVTILALITAAIVTVPVFVLAQSPGSGPHVPVWVKHVQSFPGGISNGVRAHLDLALRPLSSGVGVSPQTAGVPSLDNVQMNDETTPDLPVDETQVVLKPSNPMVAIAAANDYVSGGLWIGRTTDGGLHWMTFRAAPVSSKGETCAGGDPGLAWSQKDLAFYAVQLCFFFSKADSEVQLWKSVDDGATWTPPASGSTVFTNVASDGTANPALFYDKEQVVVDNTPSSPHYGRIYVTAIKFHMILPSGRSDFCPVQVAFTDSVPTANPRSTTWTHVPVVPDAPFSDTGPSANQWAYAVVDDTGGFDVSYAIEDCNTGYDRGLFFARSTDGGGTFSAPVRIDKPGQFADNPNRADLLPDKPFRLGLSPSIAFNPVTKTLDYVYQNNINRAISGADISFQQSSDYGATWSDAKTISIAADGSPAPNDQFYPWIAADELGGLHVIFYDNRNDPANQLIETFQALSTDDGKSWTNFDISTQAWNGDEGFFTCGCFIGDYNGLAASSHVIYPVWTDGRNSAGKPIGATDIFTNVEIGNS